jgi:4-amino-4-deoxy-L-arabinose transferase-like glycosyltransferase
LRAARAALVAGLLVAGFAVQAWFLRHYPQPMLFGDPVGYYTVGQRFQEAAARASTEGIGAAFQSIRGLLYLAGVGTLFAVMDALRPGDYAFFRLVMAGFNCLAMLGCFVLGRRLSGTFAGGLTALVLAAGYATFSVQTGRLYPDPVTGCLFVWAAALLATGLDTGRRGVTLAAGAVFGLGLLVRSQVLTYFCLLIAAGLALTARAWWRRPDARRQVAAFVAGLLPFVFAWGAIVLAVGDRDDVVQLGNATFRPYYPYGFWQYLDTDGWIGPYRFKQEPYYKMMEAEAAGDPDLLRSRGKQVAFTLRYVAARPWESALLVLDNAYRLYDRPANDYKWDYPYPYTAQVWVQRLIVILAVAAAAVFGARRPANAWLFLVPAGVAVLHGLVFPWPRYNQPAMPVLIAAAGALPGWLWSQRDVVRAQAGRPLLVLGAGLALAALGTLLRGPAPEAARVLRLLAVLVALAAPLLLVARVEGSRRARLAAAAAWLVLALPATAHALRDRRWHEVETVLGDHVAAVEQEIRLPPEALAALRTAAESFVVFDLTVPRGDLQGATVEIGGRAHPGGQLVPTMPRLREATAAGGRDRRGYPQWWAIPLDPAVLPATAAEPLRVRLAVPAGASAVLRGDRFAGQDRTYEGPSFGDWPHFVALKIEYDGDYRIPVRRPLGSVGSRSFVVSASGERRLLRAAHRIRVVSLGSNEGEIRWESAPLPAAPEVAVGWAAYSGNRGQGELRAAGRRLMDVPFGRRDDFEVSAPPYRLCHRAEPPRQDKPYGRYLLVGPPEAPGRPLALELHFRSGMSVDPMYYVVDRRRDPADLGTLLDACAAAGRPFVPGAARVIDATRNNYPEDTGRWTAAAAY